jgi:hypothetical protein
MVAFSLINLKMVVQQVIFFYFKMDKVIDEKTLSLARINVFCKARG